MMHHVGGSELATGTAMVACALAMLGEAICEHPCRAQQPPAPSGSAPGEPAFPSLTFDRWMEVSNATEREALVAAGLSDTDVTKVVGIAARRDFAQGWVVPWDRPRTTCEPELDELPTCISYVELDAAAAFAFETVPAPALTDADTCQCPSPDLGDELPQSAVEISLLFAYTPAALAVQCPGDVSPEEKHRRMEELAHKNVDEINTWLGEKLELDQVVVKSPPRVVALEDYSGYPVKFTEVLRRAIDKSDGHLDDASVARDHAAADLVVLVLPASSNEHGRACLLPGNACGYAVVKAGPHFDCLGTTLHEVKHLLGLSHSEFESSTVGVAVANAAHTISSYRPPPP